MQLTFTAFVQKDRLWDRIFARNGAETHSAERATVMSKCIPTAAPPGTHGHCVPSSMMVRTADFSPKPVVPEAPLKVM